MSSLKGGFSLVSLGSVCVGILVRYRCEFFLLAPVKGKAVEGAPGKSMQRCVKIFGGDEFVAERGGY